MTVPFHQQGRRRVEAAFDAGRVSSDAGALLLREAAVAIGLFDKLAACFDDRRDQRRIEHSVQDLVAQRILGLACGYEDLNDHDTLRNDPVFAVAVGKKDPLGANRSRKQDRGTPLASSSSLNRLELCTSDREGRADLKIRPNEAALERLFVDLFLDSYDQAPESIILDVDATDVPLHGKQEGRYFHGYYDAYCYLPIYIMCGNQLLAAKLETADHDELKGALPELKRVVKAIRERWPKVRILIRGDSKYCRDALMAWCEETEGLDFVVGLAKNARLIRAISEEQATVREQSEAAEEPVRIFKELRYQTKDSWTRERRVVSKVEHIPGKANPRFIVTSLPDDEYDARKLYEDVYCARGDMENRIKEQQMGLFADRASGHTKGTNQMRLWLSGFAYVLVETLRRTALKGTKLEKAQAWTLRNRLFKIGGLVRVSVRRIRLSLSSAFPLQDVFIQALENLRISFPAVF